MSLEETLFHVWVDTVKDFAIFMVDLEGRVSSWNVGAERILGYASAEILGQPFDRLFTLEDQQNHVPAQELQEAHAEDHGWDDRWMLRKDNSRFWASGLLTPLRGEDGSVRGYVKVLRDNTERKMMEDELRRHAEALQEADRRKNEFLAMLSHELRNPLAPILNSLYVMRQAGSHDPAVVRSHATIERQVGHLKQLVDDLVDVARVTSGKILLRKEKVWLGDLVSRSVEDIGHQIVDRQQTLMVLPAAEPIWIDADATRLEQVFINLLSNASKYTEPGGHIWLNTQKVDGMAEIRVQDDGIGIDGKLLPRIFDLFTQADASLDRSQGGLGIGLTLARTLVEMHEGTISAESEGTGKGSVFVIRLPVVDSSESDHNAGDEGQNGESGESRATLRILVVDDNVDAARSLSLFLSRAGHTTEVAHDGRAGLTAADSFDPDAVLLDIGLPGMNGFEVAQLLRESRAVTLIAMSGYAKDDDPRRATFDHYLVKPVNPEDLLALLNGLRPNPRNS